jgi:hypothetical protein
MKISTDPRRNLKLAITIGIALLAVNSAVYMLIVRPWAKAFHDLEGNRAAFNMELSNAEKRKEQLDVYWNKLTSTEQNTEKFRKEILGTRQEKSILVQREFADIATEFGIDPETVSMNNVDQDDDGLEKLQFEVPIEGDYSSLRKFLSRIENANSFLVVERVSWTGTKEGGLRLLLNIIMSTYFDAPWLKELKKPGHPERPGRKRA